MQAPLLDHGARTRPEREEGRKNPWTWPTTYFRGLRRGLFGCERVCKTPERLYLCFSGLS